MKYLLCLERFQLNLSSSLAIYMLHFEWCITCQMPLSSDSSFSTKRNAEAVDRCCNIPRNLIFNSTKPAHQRKETVEIAEIKKHNGTLVRNKKATSEIRKILVVKLGSQVSCQRG